MDSENFLDQEDFEDMTLSDILEQDEDMHKHLIYVVNGNRAEVLECAETLEKQGLAVLLGSSNHLAFKLLTGAYPTSTYPTCLSCGCIFPNDNEVQQHICISDIELSPPRERRVFPCARCPRHFLTAQALGKHKKEHDVDEFSCFECGKDFQTLQAKGSHVAWHNKQSSHKRLEAAHNELQVNHALLKTAYRELKAVNSEIEHKKFKGKLALLVTISTDQKLSAFKMIEMLMKQENFKLPVFVMLRDREVKLANKYLTIGASGIVNLPLKGQDATAIKTFLDEEK